MFDVGIGEVFVLLVVALLVFGPDRLPEMAKQTASFVRDLRTMVANARRDLSGSVGDLGIDKEDLKTLSDLRNPKSFVRKKVLDGVDLGLDDDEARPARTNGTSRTGTKGTPPRTTSMSPATPDTAGEDVVAEDVQPPPARPGAADPVDANVSSAPRFDPDAT